MSKTQKVGFSISGDFITEHCRNLCKEGKTGSAWMLLQDCLPGIPVEVTFEDRCIKSFRILEEVL